MILKFNQNVFTISIFVWYIAVIGSHNNFEYINTINIHIIANIKFVLGHANDTMSSHLNGFL